MDSLGSGGILCSPSRGMEPAKEMRRTNVKLFRYLAPIALFVLVAAVFSGCPKLTAASAAADLQDRFDAVDTDSDGQLTLAEAQAAIGGLTEAVFNEIDANADGNLTPAELEAAVQAGDEGEDEGEDDVTLTAVSTKIDMHQQGMIKAGDDVIAYGYGGFSGVAYIIPSEFTAGDPGLEIQDGDSFQAGNFEVAGTKIALASNSLVSILDTATQKMTDIPETDVRLVNSPSGQLALGTLQADGELIIVRNDEGVTGNHAAVIDVSGKTPVVIGLASPTGDNEINSIEHAVVDADAGVAVGTASVGGADTFVVWDLDNPDTEPTLYPFEDGIGDALIQIEGGFVLFHNTAGQITALNFSDEMFVSDQEAAGQVALNGGGFVYFLDRDANDSSGNDLRSAIGSIDEVGDIATFNAAGDAAGDNFIDGNTTNNGVIGWGQMGAISSGGGLFFISGRESVGSGEYLQVSNGGTFSLVQCPTCIENPHGAAGTDVDIYGKTLAFKNGDNSGTAHVAFILLP